jgi:hypothetical protein
MKGIFETFYLEEEYELIKKNYNVYIFYLFAYYLLLHMVKMYMNQILYNDLLKDKKKDKMEPPHPNNIHIDLIRSESCNHFYVCDKIDILNNKRQKIIYCNKCHTTF